MKKILTKVLAIALICVITVTSMGAYGGEIVAEEEILNSELRSLMMTVEEQNLEKVTIGYCENDFGINDPILGYRIEENISPNQRLVSLLATIDIDENAETIDGGGAFRFYLKNYYTVDGDYYLLTRVEGGYNRIDPQFKVIAADMNNACIVLFQNPGQPAQSEDKLLYVGDGIRLNYGYDTNFTNPVMKNNFHTIIGQNLFIEIYRTVSGSSYDFQFQLFA